MTTQEEFNNMSAEIRATGEYREAYAREIAKEAARTYVNQTSRQAQAEALGDLIQECWQVAEDSGWHGEETFGDKVALMHSELSEALEEFRNGRHFDEIYYSFKHDNNTIETDESHRYDDDGKLVPNKVEGIASELADVLIRIFDDSKRFGIPVVEAMLQKMEYNKTRPRRHGGKKI